MKHNYNNQEYREKEVLKNLFQSISMTEKIIFMFFSVMVVSVIVISIWSSILLVTGNTQGGGPLGIIASVIIEISN